MSEPFLSEIKIMSFNFAPKGWALCDGQLLPINQNQALFSLLGTTYGGNGQTTFALPNLRGQVPIHRGNGFALGQKGGEPSHTLTIQELTTHVHPVAASSSATGGTATPNGNFLGGGNNAYHAPPGPPGQTSLTPATVANTGSSQPHENTQPYLVLNFCIALLGIFPSRN
jgi:microcystin-dependent protein